MTFTNGCVAATAAEAATAAAVIESVPEVLGSVLGTSVWAGAECTILGCTTFLTGPLDSFNL